MEGIVPDQATIANIRTMVERSLSFFKAFGPVTADGFTMEGLIRLPSTTGDGDFLTKDKLFTFLGCFKSCQPSPIRTMPCAC
ncbi:MAG: hypothetical protein ACLR3O_06880 [Streptococcus sp.]